MCGNALSKTIISASRAWVTRLLHCSACYCFQDNRKRMDWLVIKMLLTGSDTRPGLSQPAH